MRPTGSRGYVGIHDDLYGGMTDTGKLIRDAWAFGILPESEDCKGWSPARLERLWEEVQAVWSRYGFRVSALPEEVRARYERIHAEAVARARAAGWDPEACLNDDE